MEGTTVHILELVFI